MSEPTLSVDDEAVVTPTFRDSWPADLLSGFLVFLIALPLCLGIAKASGFPPIAGIFTAVLGGIICPFISNSELTIKGPAAGMIAVVFGAMTTFGFTGGDNPTQDVAAYKAVLAIGVLAGVAQILFGFFRAGKLGDFFPTAAVHGLLASIGIIIISSQIHVVLGVKPDQTTPFSRLGEIPDSLRHYDPHIALIGLLSLAIMFAMPLVKKAIPSLKRIPAQLVVLVVAVPMAMYYHVEHDRIYIAKDHAYRESPGDALVPLPENLSDAISFPDFSALAEKPGAALSCVLMFCLVGTLESLLSAKAVDLLDPYRRTTNHDRDILSVGVANTCSAFVGGLPNISEILRSGANKDNGARTRLANFFHGLLLLLCVLFLAPVLRLIPLSALAAMLVYAGYRLAAPKEFLHMYHIGVDQLIVFVATVVGVLWTNDLLEGIAIGIGAKFLLHVINGVPISQLFRPSLQIEEVSDTQDIVYIRGAAVFSNWLSLKNKLNSLSDYPQVLVDLENSNMVDHTTMDKFTQAQQEFQIEGRELRIRGLDGMKAVSVHPLAARKRPRFGDSQVIESPT